MSSCVTLLATVTGSVTLSVTCHRSGDFFLKCHKGGDSFGDCHKGCAWRASGGGVTKFRPGHIEAWPNMVTSRAPTEPHGPSHAASLGRGIGSARLTRSRAHA